MLHEDYEDPRFQQEAEREEYEREHDAAAPQTAYAKRRRMLEKDDWYSVLDEDDR